MGYMVVNYLDDLGDAETVNKACDAYDALGDDLQNADWKSQSKKGSQPPPVWSF
jgi:hypothetical protein